MTLVRIHIDTKSCLIFAIQDAGICLVTNLTKSGSHEQCIAHNSRGHGPVKMLLTQLKDKCSLFYEIEVHCTLVNDYV